MQQKNISNYLDQSLYLGEYQEYLRKTTVYFEKNKI